MANQSYFSSRSKMAVRSSLKHALVNILGTLLLFCGLTLAAEGETLNERPDVDPNYSPIENMFLLFPMTEKDFWNWESHGSAVFLQNKAVIAPEAVNRKGLIHTTQMNSTTPTNTKSTHKTRNQPWLQCWCLNTSAYTPIHIELRGR